MKRLCRWIAARLWRRLAFYHLVAIFCTLVVVQLVVAILTVATPQVAPLPDAGTARDVSWVRFVGYLFGATLGTVPALLLSAFVAAISGIIVSRSLGRRLSPLEQTAQKMADGDLSLRVDDISCDEIGRVGQAFNRMAGQLQDSLQALEAEKEQVEALLHARRDLVSNVSHDLRTPIASLAAHLETLSEHPERLDRYLPILSDETDRVSGLIGDLFELSRLDARELELDLVPVVLSEVIEKVVTTYKGLSWEQRRIVLEARLPGALPPVQADVQRVEQVLVNLIANGLRFTPEGGVVTIEAKACPHTVEVRVTDTGIGISTEDLPRIFERSYRGDRARTHQRSEDRLGSGSGLGLAIVKGLVEAMGGTVDATSAPGEGTCVRFRLPLAGKVDILRSSRLDLVSMGADMLNALLAGDRAQAEQIGGFHIPGDLAIKKSTLQMRLRQLEADPLVQPWLLRAMVIRESRTMCGRIGFHTAPRPQYLEAIAADGVEMGYAVGERFRRQGYAKEAAIGLMRWAFERHQQRCFILSVAPDNVASMALARSMGFTQIGSHMDPEDGLELILARRLEDWPDEWK